jgi:hypothetical protein
MRFAEMEEFRAEAAAEAEYAKRIKARRAHFQRRETK